MSSHNSTKVIAIECNVKHYIQVQMFVTMSKTIQWFVLQTSQTITSKNGTNHNGNGHSIPVIGSEVLPSNRNAVHECEVLSMWCGRHTKEFQIKCEHWILNKLKVKGTQKYIYFTLLNLTLL